VPVAKKIEPWDFSSFFEKKKGKALDKATPFLYNKFILIISKKVSKSHV
jgi:hypothetical protein